MPNAYISGTGFFVPDNVVTNDDLRDVYGIETSDEWIRKRTGIAERRFAPQGMGTADMGAKAAEMAIEAAGIDKKDLGMIILATLSPRSSFRAICRLPLQEPCIKVKVSTFALIFAL